MLLSATDVTQSQRFINTTFKRDALVINLSLDPDSITANDLTRFEESSRSAIRGIEVMALALSQVIHAWDVEDSDPTPEYLLTLPIGLLSDLNRFAFEEIMPDKDDLMNLRRYFLMGGAMGSLPDYYWDIRDAQVLGVPFTEINDVPLHWRLKARVVDKGIKQARESMARKYNLPFLPEI